VTKSVDLPQPFQSEQFCSVTVIDAAYIKKLGERQSCRKNGDIPNSPLPTIGSLVPSVGTIPTPIKEPRSALVPSAPASVAARAARSARPSDRKAKAMQVPSILLGESRTRLLQGIAIGAVASMVIGFSWGGWMTGGTAIKLADQRANTAVVAALTPICVEKFLQNSDAKANLAVLQKMSTSMGRGDYLEKGGWATRPGATSPDYQLARACAEKLAQAKTAAQ
jgi:hypothetical protein